MINRDNLYIGQTVTWVGEVDNGMNGKIEGIYAEHFDVLFSDGELVGYKYDDSRAEHDLDFGPPKKIKTVTRSDIKEMLEKMYKIGWQDFENKGPYIPTNRADQLMKKYL